MQKEEKEFKPTIYVVNKSGHDFTDAYRFGEKLIYLSEGFMERYHLNGMYRQFFPILLRSNPNDYILPSGLNNMNIMASGIFISIHGRVNLLLWQRDRYVEQKIVFSNEKKEEENE